MKRMNAGPEYACTYIRMHIIQYDASVLYRGVFVHLFLLHPLRTKTQPNPTRLVTVALLYLTIHKEGTRTQGTNQPASQSPTVPPCSRNGASGEALREKQPHKHTAV